MSNKQAKRIKTTYDHFSYKHIDYVREIHSTDTNIFRTVKRTIPTTLTWTSHPGYPIQWHPWIKQNQNIVTCVSIRHLAWILCDSSLIRESDLAMSSSGKRRQTNTNHHQRQNKNNTHKTQTRNESTNMFMCHLCPIHVLYIHLYITQKLILPGYNPMKFLAPFQDLLSISPFLLSTDIWSDGNEYMMDRVNLELANG